MITEKRKMDGTGRVIIPAEYRKYLNLKCDDNIEFIPCKEGILIRKAIQGCFNPDNSKETKRPKVRDDELIDFIVRKIIGEVKRYED